MVRALIILSVVAWASTPAYADSICASMAQLHAPPAPGAICAPFQVTYAALAAYSRDAVSTCATENARVQAAAAHGDAAQMMQAQTNLQTVKMRNERPVKASFPAQGVRVSTACLSVLDTYQAFTYSLNSSIDDAIRSVTAKRAELQFRPK